MVTAREANFIEDGPIDPFAGLAPALTPAEQAAQEQARIDARRERERLLGRQAANINNRPGGYMDGRETFNTNAIDPRTGQPYTGKERPTAPGSSVSAFMNESLQTVKEHPWLPLLPMAPLTMAALAPAAAGSGTIAGGSAASESALPYAYAASDPAYAEATMNAARVPATAGGAPLTAAAPTPGLGGMVAADAAKYAPGVALAAAPLVINELTSGQTKEERALLAKQEQLAQEARVRQGQRQDARMNQLGQQLLAFNPRNQMMAEVFGPEAAFQPEQMAQMVQGQPPPQIDPSLVNYQGTDPRKRAEVAEYVRRKQEFDKAEAQRREMMMSSFQAPGPGPAPIQMPAPQAARRY